MIHVHAKCLVVLAVVAGMAAAAGAVPTPAQKCAAAKIKATGKKIGAKAKCQEKGILTALPADSTCLAKAEVKFSSTIAKAELKGGCPLTGDTATLEAVADQAVNNAAAFTPAVVPSCCSFAPGFPECVFLSNPGDCSGGTVGPAGSVCDGVTGACVSPPATPGNCCQGAPFIGGAVCGGGADFTESTCEGFGATFVPNALCPPNGGTCVAF